jgi:DICT domain-containing protein/signal transduction histidine kinase
MIISTSVLTELLTRLPDLHPQMYFKASLTALSHAMEDQVLAGGDDQTLVIASFQQERFYRQEAHRYRRIAEQTSQVYVLAAPETNFKNCSDRYETIAFEPADQLSHEWHLVVIGNQYSACLVCREREPSQAEQESDQVPAMDQTRRFEGIWTFDRYVSSQAADILLDRVLAYRPELVEKVANARTQLRQTKPPEQWDLDPDPFAQRLVTYLQAGQYKLLKAYRSIAAQERRERLVNLITGAVRQSLDPDEIFRVAVQELGQAMQVCRCLIYKCQATDSSTQIEYEYLSDPDLLSLMGQTWQFQGNPLFQYIASTHDPVSIADTQTETTHDLEPLRSLIQRWQIRSWLLVPLIYQGRLLGMVELHNCKPFAYEWSEDEIALVQAIATQLAVGLIQAQSYAHLEDLNQQLAALETARSNLIAITGHELRTPLSTIQICLESLASEPDMPLDLRQVMLNTALADAERMRTLIQDFITLSRLESGRVEWHLEPLALSECVDLALSSIYIHHTENLPTIKNQVSNNLPMVKADGEWLVEVLSKLLDNACKFTGPEGEVAIAARPSSNTMLEVTITDTGRGIEPNRLEAVFDRFYQEEDSLRRTAGGTGLGLAICRQIVLGLGGEIWAESAGRDQGSTFHFTVPIAQEEDMAEANIPIVPARSRRSRTSRRSRATLG